MWQSQVLGFPALEAAFHCFSNRDGLRQRKAHGGIDADPPVVASSIATIPARVAAILTIMLGASLLNLIACVSIASELR